MFGEKKATPAPVAVAAPPAVEAAKSPAVCVYLVESGLVC
jgi:hypothetical protein